MIRRKYWGLTCSSRHAGQNHLDSPSGRSLASIGGSRHIQWKALVHPSQYTSAPRERQAEQWSSLGCTGTQSHATGGPRNEKRLTNDAGACSLNDTTIGSSFTFTASSRSRSFPFPLSFCARARCRLEGGSTDWGGESSPCRERLPGIPWRRQSRVARVGDQSPTVHAMTKRSLPTPR